MRQKPFSRPTMIAATELLESHTQARFDQMVLRLSLENEIVSDTTVSVGKKCVILGRIIVQQADKVLDTLGGSMTLGEAVVREAVQILSSKLTMPSEVALSRGLERDGYIVSFDNHGRNPKLRAALPEEVRLPETDDEVHQLLKSFHFTTPLGHLDQAVEAHTRGDWAACNSQLRTFLESLFDDIARKVCPNEAAQRPSSENRRALLADPGVGFFAVDRNEWTADGKNYVNGLFKMLHTEGSHPGLSYEDHSTFRLHIVLITARAFLRRLHYGR